MTTAIPLTNTNIYLESSGSTGMSGTNTLGPLSGPWFIETQNLEIKYMRLPFFTSGIYKPGLSSTTATLGGTGTRLIVSIQANYAADKIDGQFATSSWTQSQRFHYIPYKTDMWGNDVGPVGPSALGGHGTIKTSHPWYYRRPWKEETDKVNHETVWGALHYGETFMMQDFNNNKEKYEGMVFIRPSSVNNVWGGPNNISRYNQRMPPWFGLLDFSVVDSPAVYVIPGYFHTSKESPQLIQEMINKIGTRVGNTRLIAMTSGDSTENYTYTPPPQDVGCPSYSASRHSWT